MAGDPVGSTAMAFRLGLCSFNRLVTPVKVPPVPIPATNTSTFGTCSTISVPVVR